MCDNFWNCVIIVFHFIFYQLTLNAARTCFKFFVYIFFRILVKPIWIAISVSIIQSNYLIISFLKNANLTITCRSHVASITLITSHVSHDNIYLKPFFKSEKIRQFFENVNNSFWEMLPIFIIMHEIRDFTELTNNSTYLMIFNLCRCIFFRECLGRTNCFSENVKRADNQRAHPQSLFIFKRSH